MSLHSRPTKKRLMVKILFIGILLAFLLDPIVDFLEKKSVSRGLATSLILILFFIITTIISLIILPILLIQIRSFLIEFPEIINSLNENLNLLVKFFQEKTSS